jgi:O-acetyl-ADP-ribose deacetylase (regulator of RNase III)
MGKTNNAFSIGRVELIPMLGDITTLEADAVVQPGGTSVHREIQVSPWASQMLEQELDAFSKHMPLQLGDVIVTHAGALSARYLFNAIVLDWGHQHPSGELVIDDVVASVARRCIKIAAALELRSIAFTPWGTRVSNRETSEVTALMVNAIVSQLQEDPGSLESVYLISNNPEHYHWFVDRAFVFQLLFAQVSQMRNTIENLDIPQSSRQQLIDLLEDFRANVVVYNEIVGGDKTTVGDISESTGIAIGTDAQTNVTQE